MRRDQVLTYSALGQYLPYRSWYVIEIMLNYSWSVLLDYNPCAPFRNGHVEASRKLRSGQYFACSLFCYWGASFLPATTTTDCDLLARNMDLTFIHLVRLHKLLCYSRFLVCLTAALDPQTTSKSFSATTKSSIFSHEILITCQSGIQRRQLGLLESRM